MAKKQNDKPVNPKDLFDNLPVCQAESTPGRLYRALVSQLTPTQNGVGLDEVYAKEKRLRKKSGESLKDYLFLRPIPLVIGNKGQFYLIDHHHLAYTVWQVFKDIYLPVQVVENWSEIKGYSFWKAMTRKNYWHPFGGDGAGPLPPKKMKTHIKDLENDIFRSLSWVVRSHYGYLKSSDNIIFTEFQWGNFFRQRIRFKLQMKGKGDLDIKSLTLKQIREKGGEDAYQSLIAEAMSLATTKEARALPGYRGP